MAAIPLGACPSDGAFGSRSPVVGARVVGSNNAAEVLPGDAVTLELLTSGGQPLEVVWVSCNGPIASGCTIFGGPPSLPYCPSDNTISELGVISGCIAGHGQQLSTVVPALGEEPPQFPAGSLSFEAWYRRDGGDVRRCVDGRVPGCSMHPLSVELGPTYAYAQLRLDEYGELEIPLEAYDESIQGATPNRNPVILGIEVDGQLFGPGEVVARRDGLELDLVADEPEAFVRDVLNEQGGVSGEPSIETYAVTWVVGFDSGHLIHRGPTLRLGDVDEPVVVDVLLLDDRGGASAAWLVLD